LKLEIDEDKDRHKKNEGNAKRILIDFIKYHLIPHIVELKIVKEMFDALVGLLERKKLALINYLRCIMMTKSDLVATYFMKVSQLIDQLMTIGDTIDDAELVTVTLNRFPSSWEPFVQIIYGREEFPKFDHLWIDSVQEEAGTFSKKQLVETPG